MNHLRTAVLYTIISAVFLGLGYPLIMTGLAQWIFPRQANGSLIVRNGQVIGSKLIGQTFSGAGYFHSRPSAAGNGYDAESSGGSNLAPTNHALIQQVEQRAAAEQVGATKVPVDLVTASASGLDPDITPAAAYYQAPRIAKARHLPLAAVRKLIAEQTTARQFGLLGEPRVNVLAINLKLDQMH
ncbi:MULTISPECIES: potassium-transporting ATPase subunit KdpC [Acidobacterium]|uniref:Potassium-transporting ATPase KdpC subunit n=1 Tax=Acidobacterium capsulatum (strain ATCC 51196 / DSM 11244 / BCRC 80197 / JCM 7670 / NBRC 15755 / NCIMB 13165 / 161) TaxID=240015 RepID=KDPC_ACIC5|nr:MULTISPECIES: potassium-transporting ATPase subunit KdpC [Acidobacterium]C1F0T4.1 RecName: Full=Potassium-transporting ATPase KdpC subunit; AltName: Full=ATP phosphohydrolase [potassium-transporting] C chain; AltName: Full=Potassium-binding and translocating subunit C; AltName: Full=Potassium-translocating ATPase C chain [Acidobacterium capsulatum ATCC 51196]ACO31418.1 K+-transporting ATPase, C subunit [Acidobacterium capsulatum ATCC 51196]HCT62026.1 potassium-transporting ATPase subunit C [A